MRFFDQFSVQKMHDDLDEWIHIGVGYDIVDLRDQRKEYAPLVQTAIIERAEDIPRHVLKQLKYELKEPWYNRPSFWHCVSLFIRRLFGWR